jgi:hypothetical protein
MNSPLGSAVELQLDSLGDRIPKTKGVRLLLQLSAAACLTVVVLTQLWEALHLKARVLGAALHRGAICAGCHPRLMMWVRLTVPPPRPGNTKSRAFGGQATFRSQDAFTTMGSNGMVRAPADDLGRPSFPLADAHRVYLDSPSYLSPPSPCVEVKPGVRQLNDVF